MVPRGMASSAEAAVWETVDEVDIGAAVVEVVASTVGAEAVDGAKAAEAEAVEAAVGSDAARAADRIARTLSHSWHPGLSGQASTEEASLRPLPISTC